MYFVNSRIDLDSSMTSVLHSACCAAGTRPSMLAASCSVARAMMMRKPLYR